MKKYTLNYQEFVDVARCAIAEGQVLLENKKNVLPIAKGSRVSVFGRMQNHYYKSGTGSGGMVNVNRIYTILDGLYAVQNDTNVISVNEELVKIYKDFERKSPYEDGIGWGAELWSQKEMELTDEIVNKASENSDIAVCIIARSSGEDQDNKYTEGSYLLTELEKNMLSRVRKGFNKMVLVLNTGNIIDMNYIKEVAPDAILYSWQGGMIGGLGVADVLVGLKSPSGHLSDTVAIDIKDYPASDNFGDEYEVTYAEDIFVGYRYFETFAKDRVYYPFGYGLTYTTFDIKTDSVDRTNDGALVKATVTNTGSFTAKEVVQVYIEAPQGVLGKPKRVLAGFAKTKDLEPGQSERVNITIDNRDMSSFDETSKVGLGTGFVMEKGEYSIYVGNNVRDAVKAGGFTLAEDVLVEGLINALGPVKDFKRMIAVSDADGSVSLSYEDVPLRTDTQKSRRDNNLPKDITQTGDKGYKLSDVKSGTVSIEDFVAQLSDEELCMIIRNEGMSSPQVTPGTAAAFGGIHPSLKDKGIPIGCMDDGPSGMRLDSGVKAFALPNGTLLSCTFNPELNEKLFSYLAIEMLKNKVDVLLGPGMNIHRFPLNGRNFEYFSEDPYLTGAIGSSQIRGLQSAGVTGTIKHFACNNQEVGRQQVNPLVSERALREIYLRGFEMAVDAGADAVMTTYCQINGVWTAGCYDLNTTILRDQWGFKGIVMTDWWANISEEGSPGTKTNFAAMVRAQNDLYACTPSATADVGDNAYESLKKGTLTRGEIQRCAVNICEFLTKYAVFDRFYGEDIIVDVIGSDDIAEDIPTDIDYQTIGNDGIITLDHVVVNRGGNHYMGVTIDSAATYEITLVGRGMAGNELAQIPIVLYVGEDPKVSFVYRGTGEWVEQSGTIELSEGDNILHLYFGINGIELKELRFVKK